MNLEVIFIEYNIFEFDQNVIRNIICCIFNDEDYSPGYIKIIFASDNYVKKINKDFLNHNLYTDIITFGEKRKNYIDGQLFISIDRVMKNCQNYSDGNFNNELLRVIIHGILHLIGYQDYTLEQRESMRKLEDFYLLIAHNIE